MWTCVFVCGREFLFELEHTEPKIKKSKNKQTGLHNSGSANKNRQNDHKFQCRIKSFVSGLPTGGLRQFSLFEIFMIVLERARGRGGVRGVNWPPGPGTERRYAMWSASFSSELRSAVRTTCGAA